MLNDKITLKFVLVLNIGIKYELESRIGIVIVYFSGFSYNSTLLFQDIYKNSTYSYIQYLSIFFMYLSRTKSGQTKFFHLPYVSKVYAEISPNCLIILIFIKFPEKSKTVITLLFSFHNIEHYFYFLETTIIFINQCVILLFHMKYL